MISNGTDIRTRRRLPAAMTAMLIAACFAFAGCSGIRTNYVTYKDAAKYRAGNFEYTASDISEVEINWVNGDITVTQGTGSSLSVAEEDNGLKESQKLHWYQHQNKLVIQYCGSGYRGSFPKGSKALTIEVPVGIDLSVNTVNGKLTMENQQIYGTVDIDMVAGKISMEPKDCDQIAIDTVSANVDFLSLPGGGATIDFDRVSGKLNTSRDYEKKNEKYIFGDGECKIKIDTVSGNIHVQ